MMMENSPTNEEWRELYEVSLRIKELAPWEWMTETDIFGVQNPENDELGFVSVMGMAGEHYAVSLYLGPEGLYGFWDFEETGPLGSPEGLLEIPQLQASFENRSELREKDRELIKALGFKFRGKHAWPMFRSYRPGFFPWYLEAEEARFLTQALNQLLDVAPRFKENPSLLEPPADESYLVRVPRREEKTLIWEDRLMDVPPPEPSSIPVSINSQMLATLRSLPPGRMKLEMDLFMFPAPIRETEARPYFPYMLMMVETQSGMILCNEMLTPEPSLRAMWGLVPQIVVHQLASAQIVPKEVTVASELLYQLLEPLAEMLRFKLKQSSTLPNLHPAKEFLFQRFV